MISVAECKIGLIVIFVDTSANFDSYKLPTFFDYYFDFMLKSLITRQVLLFRWGRHPLAKTLYLLVSVTVQVSKMFSSYFGIILGIYIHRRHKN